MLKYKLFKWFAGLVLVFGALAAGLGIWVISQRIIQEAQTRVRFDLSSAWAVYHAQLDRMETISKLTAIRGPLVDACAGEKWRDRATREELQGILGRAQLDFRLDFAGLVTPDGQVVVRASPPYRTGDYLTSEPVIAKALGGTANSGTVVFSKEELKLEADGLIEPAFMELQETPHARATPKSNEERGMTMLAAAPILDRNRKLVGAIYVGVLLNRNVSFVDRVQEIVFGQERYQGKAVGGVTVFLGDTRIATTIRGANGNRAIGTRASREVAEHVLDNGRSWNDKAFVVQDWYLTAYDPIKDSRGSVVGMLYAGTMESPFTDLRRGLILRYGALVAGALVVALLMAMFIAGRLARPLHRLAEGADKMKHGHVFEPVPSDRSCHETDGLIEAFNEMASTLTEREKQLTEANEHFGSANDSLKAMNAHYMETLQFVSHELNSPLSSIMNYAYMLRQKLLGDLTDKQVNALGVMSDNLKRVMEMIRHYLNLARIEKGEIQPVCTRVSIREDVIAPILASLQAEMHTRNQRVEDLIAPKLFLHTDLNMTREVFENLLSNAVKYGRAGGLISLKSHIDGAWAEFAVRNEGEGIPAERRGELFQKFSRLEVGERKTGPRGTGLGLFICKKIVESHGGTIAVDSEVGHWTEFRLRLPLARETGHPTDGKPAKSEPKAPPAEVTPARAEVTAPPAETKPSPYVADAAHHGSVNVAPQVVETK